jgi:Single Cache domain 2
VKEDKAKALDMFNKGEGGFKDRDLYVFCANTSDGILTAHPYLKGEQLQDIKGKKGYPLGKEIMQNATEGTIKQLTYWWPRPGTEKPLRRSPSTRGSEIKTAGSATTRNNLPDMQDRLRQSMLLKIQYATITAMKNDMRSARPAMAAIMVA